MPYTANVPKGKYYNNNGPANRRNDRSAGRSYHNVQEGLPDNNSTVIQYLSSEAIFYSIDDVMQLTGWSRAIVQRLFNQKDFPYTNIGKRKLVEAHALIAYFSVKRLRSGESA